MARESLLYTWKNKHLTSLAVMVVALAVRVLFAILFAHSASAITTVPTKMNFQGRLTDSSGAILTNGTYNMRFRVYSVASGGSALWSEDRLVSASQGVTVTNGQFSVQLGDVTSLPASLFASSPLYFEIELPTPATATGTSPSWTEGAMTPRNPLATSAYAFNSDTLDGYDSDDFAKVGGSNTFTGTNTFRNTSNSSSAFAIQNSSGTNLLVADTTNSRIYIGNPTTDASTTFLAVDTYNGGSSDPANGFNGAIYYNTTLNKLRCFENGAWANCIGSGSSTGQTFTTVKLASDVSNSALTANTLADVTGLSFPVTAGQTYRFKAFIEYTAAATTTGSRWTINGPSGAIVANSTYTLTATTQTLNYVNAYSSPSASNATSLTAGNIAEIEGRVKPTANGTVQVQFASEVSLSAVTAKAGSSLLYWVE